MKNLTSTRLSPWTTADVPDQSGRVALVTGANSGIGWQTALELARAGAHVVLVTRSDAKRDDAIARIRSEVPHASLESLTMDLASLRSIREAVDRLAVDHIDLLVNNAGVMAVPRRESTEDGFERQFGTNFLGPFALTMQLMPALFRSSTPRVTTVSSGAANMGLRRINFEDPQWQRGYKPWRAYCQSKLADLLMATELARRAQAADLRLVSNASHPGYARTNLQTSGPGRPQGLVWRWFESLVSQDAAMGALPTLRAATMPDAVSGTYWAPSGFLAGTGYPVRIDLPAPARDEQAARRLWELAETLTDTRWPKS